MRELLFSPAEVFSHKKLKRLTAELPRAQAKGKELGCSVRPGRKKTGRFFVCSYGTEVEMVGLVVWS